MPGLLTFDANFAIISLYPLCADRPFLGKNDLFIRLCGHTGIQLCLSWPEDKFGVWRSLVAHLLWEQGVGGSNPSTPTIYNRVVGDCICTGKMQFSRQNEEFCATEFNASKEVCNILSC